MTHPPSRLSNGLIKRTLRRGSQRTDIFVVLSSSSYDRPSKQRLVAARFPFRFGWVTKANTMTNNSIPHAIQDRFLPASVATTLLDEIIAAAALFTPSHVGGIAEGKRVPAMRSSLRLPGRVGVNLVPFRNSIKARSADLCKAIGIQPFPIYHLECSVVAHGDGHYYRKHIDIGSGTAISRAKHHRMVSCVYYLYREPKAFSGGALHLHGLDAPRDQPSQVVIEPAHNRLAVFPAFIPHEVRDIACPDHTFESSRFSINCWLHRERSGSDTPGP